jgi:dienelactone hydrolase
MLRIAAAFGITGALSIVGSAHAAPPTPPPIEAYGKLPALDMVRLSPSGERYAFIAEIGDKPRLVIATTDNKPLDVLDIGDAKVRNIEWAGDDRILITKTNTVELGIGFTVSKNELASVIVYNMITHKNFAVFGKEHEQRVANTVRGEFGTAQIDGHWYGYFGGITYEKGASGPTVRSGVNYADLYRVDLDTGELKLAAHGQEDGDDWLVGPDGEVVARWLYEQKTGDWRVMKGKSGGETLASGHDDIRRVRGVAFGRSRDTILFATPDQSGGDFYREVSLTGAPIEQEQANTRPLFDPTTRLWIGVRDDEDRQAVLFSPTLQARWAGAIKAFPGYRVHLHSWTPDFNRIIVSTEGKDDSGTYWIVDIAKHSADPLGAIYPAIKPANVGPLRIVAYTAGDGLPLQGILTLPPGREPKNLPLVVMPHGGPEARDYPRFDWWAQAFASQGYAVFQPNFRGSAGYGIAFRNAGFGQWGRKMQTDISDGVAALVKQGIVDPKRACIVGGSYGGYAALAGVTVQQGLYRCAVSVAGVSDLSGMLYHEREKTQSSNSATRYWKEFMGVTSSWGNDLDKISPADLADHADAPILLIHGKDDTVVPIEQSETMERALKRAKKPVEFVMMTGEDHGLSREETRITMLKSAVAFVEKYNPAN